MWEPRPLGFAGHLSSVRSPQSATLSAVSFEIPSLPLMLRCSSGLWSCRQGQCQEQVLHLGGRTNDLINIRVFIIYIHFELKNYK